MHLSWILPDLIVGSGGHRNILRAVYYLERFGHTCELYFQLPGPDTAGLREQIHRHFYPIEGPIHAHVEGMKPTEFVIATHWTTVEWALRCRALASKEVIYFVQDFEPLFSPVGSEYVLAENTYGQGLYCITLGPWCATLLRKQFGARADSFQFPIDHDTYFPRRLTAEAARRSVLFLAKPGAPRRCYDFGVAALARLHARHPEVDIGFFGADGIDLAALPFPVVQHGLVKDIRDLAELYRRHTLGIVFSPTNPSSIGYEMMACGLPVVDLGRAGAELNYGGRSDIALLGKPDPDGLADDISRLLQNPAELTRRRSNGLVFAGDLPSDTESVVQIEALLRVRSGEHEAAQRAREKELAWSGAHGHAMIDVTSFCNLRCVYCHQSRPDYKGEHADENLLRKLPAELKSVGVEGVTLAGDGEITVYKEWDRLAGGFRDGGIQYSLLTNLSYEYSDHQLGLLARASELTVSFDTYDAELHARIRRRSSLAIILRNLARIVEIAAAQPARPRITQNCVVSDRNVFALPEIVSRAREQGIDRIALLYLIKSFDVPDGLNVIPLELLGEAERKSALDSVAKAVALARVCGVELLLSDILRDMLAASAPRVPPQPAAAAPAPVARVAPASPGAQAAADPWTRHCVHPWKGLFVQRNGKVGPCCLLQDCAGDLMKDSLESIVAGPKMQALRAALLAGNLDKSVVPEAARTCAKCSIYPKVPASQLRQELGF